MSEPLPPAGWYADPGDATQYRYWDGAQWTNQTSPAQAAIDPRSDPVFTGAAPASADAERVEHEVEAAVGQLPGPGGGTIWTEAVLVIARRGAGLLGGAVSTRYDVLDQRGGSLGAFSVQDAQQSGLGGLARAAAGLQGLARVFELRDAGGALQLTVERDKSPLKPRYVVRQPGGGEYGSIQSHALQLKAQIELMAGDSQIGVLRGPPWGGGPGPNFGQFAAEDARGERVATISPSRPGLGQILGDEQHYVLVLHRALDAPLLQLVVASALSIDRARAEHTTPVGAHASNTPF